MTSNLIKIVNSIINKIHVKLAIEILDAIYKHQIEKYYDCETIAIKWSKSLRPIAMNILMKN